MNVDQVQRWSEGRARYHPAGEPIDTLKYDVVPMAGKDPRCVAFVERHHYSRSYPAGRFSFGLWKNGVLEGVAVFSVPPCAAVLTNVFHCDVAEASELGRFVLLDGVPANGETWFLGRAFELLRKDGLLGIVSFSDPVARKTEEGNVVHRGHIGTIYQAHNAVYLGRATARTLRVFRKDGTVFNDRTAQKIRKKERGWEGAVRTLTQEYGAKTPAGGELRDWLRSELGRLTYPLPHPGNFRYAWALDRRLRKSLPKSLPYPKVSTA